MNYGELGVWISTISCDIVGWVICMLVLYRFVRSVSTPEVLELVTIVESEILQLEGRHCYPEQ